MNLNDIGTWYKDVLSPTNGFKNITDMAKIQNAFSANNMSELLASGNRAKLLPNYDLLTPSLKFKQNSLFELHDNLEALKNKFSGDNSLMSLSAAMAAKLSLADLVKEQFENNRNILSLQHTLSAKMGHEYALVNSLDYPNWLKKESLTIKNVLANPVSAFNILSAKTLVNITQAYDEESGSQIDPEDNINQINKLLDENSSFKKDLQKFYIIFAKNVASKVSKKKKIKEEDLKEPKRVLAEFIHKHLLSNNKIKLQVVYTFVCFIDSLILGLLMNIIIEANGTNMYKSIFGDNDKIITQPIQQNNYNITNNYSNVLKDFVIIDTKIYSRNSIKTKCLGQLQKLTTVLILKQKPNWCYVEALVLTKNKEKKVIKGWIKKNKLDYFQ